MNIQTNLVKIGQYLDKNIRGAEAHRTHNILLLQFWFGIIVCKKLPKELLS